MVSIARKNLFHDKRRLAIILIGLATAIVMILYGFGSITGTIDESVGLIDKIDTDIWVMGEGNTDILTPSIIAEDTIESIKEIKGVERVHKLIYSVSKIEKGEKQLREIFIIGFELRSEVGLPWGLITGNINDLNKNDTIILDESIERRLGNIAIGDSVKINNEVQEVTGICTDAKMFIHPYVFTSYENAKKLCRLRENETNFILVGVNSDYKAEKVVSEVNKINGLDAFTRSEVRENTINYYIFETPIGMGFGLSIMIGFFISIVIIVLTIYTATIERIPEFGTLKAIGASRKNIYGILIEQVVISVTLGFAIGLICSYILGMVITRITLLPIAITPVSIITVYCLTLLLSIIGSFLPIRRLNRIDPAIVFRV